MMTNTVITQFDWLFINFLALIILQKRVGRVKRKYDYTGIENTPFTVVVSLPEHGHGSYRVHATEEIHRSQIEGKSLN